MVQMALMEMTTELNLTKVKKEAIVPSTINVTTTDGLTKREKLLIATFLKEKIRNGAIWASKCTKNA